MGQIWKTDVATAAGGGPSAASSLVSIAGTTGAVSNYISDQSIITTTASSLIFSMTFTFSATSTVFSSLIFHPSQNTGSLIMAFTRDTSTLIASTVVANSKLVASPGWQFFSSTEYSVAANTSTYRIYANKQASGNTNAIVGPFLINAFAIA